MIVLYALVPAGDTSPAATAPDGLRVLARGSVAALYDEREEAPSTSRQDILDFGRVVSDISKAGPALPVRFGTVVESLGALGDLLESREAEWRERLATVAGHVEIVVHAQDAAAPAPTPAAPGSGREYLMSRAAARRHAEAMYDDLTAGLSAHCRESRRLQASEEIRVACLVPAGDTESFLAAVESWAGAQQGRRVTTTGPWPPFSFTEKETG